MRCLLALLLCTSCTILNNNNNNNNDYRTGYINLRYNSTVALKFRKSLGVA